MRGIVVALSTLGAVLLAVAIISALGSNNQAPDTIKAGFGAMTNIFKGAFS